MAQIIIAEWEGREYDRGPKNADWYWALGIVAGASAVAAALFGNYLFAVLIIIAAVAISLHGASEAPVHQFRLTDAGLHIGSDLHPFEEMLSFSVYEDIAGELPAELSIKTKNWHSPHLVVPLAGVDADLVYAQFLHHVEERAHPHSFSDLVAAWLGF